MPRQSDIPSAFINSIKRDPKRGQTISTQDFVFELAKLNHFWSRGNPPILNGGDKWDQAMSRICYIDV